MRLARVAVVLLFACLLVGGGPAAASTQTVLGGTYTIATPPTQSVAGATMTVQVQITNTGDEAWPSTGPNLVNLTYHWYDATGATVVWEGQRTAIGAPDLAPQGTRTLATTVVAPATPGQYTLRFALVKEGVAWFTPSAPLPVLVLAPTFLASYQLQTTLGNAAAGAILQVPLSVTNTGNQTWNAAGANPVNLTYHWYDAAGSTAVVWDGLRTSLGADVAPQAARGVTANVALPKDAGTYQLKFALVKEGVAWFPPSNPSPVAALAPYVAQVTATALPPMIAGGTYTVPVTVKNTGAANWNATGANLVDASYHWHDSAGNTVVWDGLRTKLAADVAPGATATVNVQVATPTAGGAYTLTVDLVREGVGWFGTQGGTPFRSAVNVQPATFTASYSMPTSLAAYWAEAKTIAVNVANTGNQTWPASGPNPVNLSYHIFDAAGNTVVWDGTRTPLGADMAPGAQKSFTIAFIAPTTSGAYTVAIDLVREGIGWFSGNGAPQGRVAMNVTSGLNGGYGATTTPGQVTIGAVIDLTVAVVNYAGKTWPAAGPNPVHLSYHIFGAISGDTYVWDGTRANLPTDVQPGTQVTVPIRVTVPAGIGDYILAWDLVQEGVAWFSSVNVTSKREPFTVVSGVVFYGSGFGHGVGMSQYGAQGYATGASGPALTGEQIIAKYFPGTTLAFGDATRPFNRVLLSQPSTSARYRCGTNAYFDGYFGDVASNGGFKVLDEANNNNEIGRGSVTAKWQFVATNGMVDVWSNNTSTPVKLGSYPSVAVVPLDPVNFPLRFFQKDHTDGTPGFYRGNLRFTNLGNTLRVVNAVTYDDYVRGVISFEMPNTWHPEALKAQAYAARSYAYASYRGGTRDYDVSDDQSDQCYGGVAAEGPRTNTAVAATAGKFVTYNGAAAKTYFASSSGGYTLEFGCWGTRVVRNGAGSWQCTPDPSQPFLAAVPDPGDRAVNSPANPRASWSAVFTGSQIVNAVICAGGPNIGVLQGVDVTNTSPAGSGHVISIRFIGSAATADVRAEAVLQSCLGLRSTMVRLAPF